MTSARIRTYAHTRPLPLLALALAALAGLGALAGEALAQAYPNKPIRLIVPFPAGGSADASARIVAAPMAAALGQPILVENRAGADGAIAGEAVAKSAPDGYTLFYATNSAMSAVPHLRKNPPYDALKDFTPIVSIGRFTFFLFVSADLPVSNVQQLISYAKANPGKLDYGTGNTTSIIATAAFRALTGTNMVHIPYKGDAPALADLVAGRVKVLIATPTGVLGQVKEGRVKVLATLLPQRSHLMPDTPTMAEEGLGKFGVTPWGGLFGPANMPREVVDRIAREANAALKRPEVSENLLRQAYVPLGSTTEEFVAFVREQHGAWGQAIRDAGIKPD